MTALRCAMDRGGPPRLHARLAGSMRLWLVVALYLTVSAGDALGQQPPANAVVFSPAIFYRSLKTESGEDEKLLITGLNLGFKINVFYAGYLLSRESSDPPNSAQKSHGPSIGLIFSGYDFIATYHVFSERDTGLRTLKDGRGIQIDLGRKFMQSSSFGLGPRLSFKRFRYRRESVGGVESEIPGGVTVEEFVPTFAAIFFF